MSQTHGDGDIRVQYTDCDLSPIAPSFLESFGNRLGYGTWETLSLSLQYGIRGESLKATIEPSDLHNDASFGERPFWLSKNLICFHGML